MCAVVSKISLAICLLASFERQQRGRSVLGNCKIVAQRMSEKRARFGSCVFMCLGKTEKERDTDRLDSWFSWN